MPAQSRIKLPTVARTSDLDADPRWKWSTECIRRFSVRCSERRHGSWRRPSTVWYTSRRLSWSTLAITWPRKSRPVPS